MAAEDVWEKSCCYRPWNGEDGLPIPPYAVYNIGNQNPENLLDFVQILSEELVRAKVLPEDYDFEAHKELVPMQPGDVPVTYADTSALERDFGYKPVCARVCGSSLSGTQSSTNNEEVAVRGGTSAAAGGKAGSRNSPVKKRVLGGRS